MQTSKSGELKSQVAFSRYCPEKDTCPDNLCGAIIMRIPATIRLSIHLQRNKPAVAEEFCDPDQTIINKFSSFITS